MKFVDEIRKIPLFRIVIPVILGVIFQIEFHFQWSYNLLVVLFALVFSFFIASDFVTSQKYRTILFGSVISLAMFFAGMELVRMQEHKRSEMQLSENGTYVGVVSKEPKLTEKSVKLELEIKYVKSGNQLVEMEQKILAYVPKDTLSLQLFPGQRIIFKADLQEVQNMGNPDEFDYKEYLALHSIYDRAFIKSQNWALYEDGTSVKLRHKAQNLRARIISKFQKFGIQDQQLAVLSALSLGYKNKLDAEVKHAYSASGGMHVLAVSGLHVGIIYVILTFLLKSLRRRRYGRFLEVLCILSFLWFYAFLTGLSPSVFRATIMFSIISIGTLFKKNTNIYNSIAASILILLFINPFIIKEIGFQLSYLAVIGIIFFQPKIYQLWDIQNSFLDKVWALVTVSLAAQIGTAPISLFYFHQFPSYFLLTNFIVIPYASVLIYGTVLFLIFSFLEPVAMVLGKVLNALVFSLNYAIQSIENIPGSLIRNIEFGPGQLILTYIFIIVISTFFVYKRNLYFIASLIVIILYLGLVNIKTYIKKKSEKFIVYNIPGQSFAQIKTIPSTKNIFYKEQMEFNGIIQPYIQNADNEQFVFLMDSEHDNWIVPNHNLYASNGKRILFLNSDQLKEYENTGEKLSVEYIILMQDVNLNIPEILEFFDCKKIIIDSSNSYFKRDTWKKQCAENNIPVTDVKTDGAFIAEL